MSVDQDAEAAGDVADDVHHLALAGALAALVDDGEGGVVETLGQRPRPDDAATSGETTIRFLSPNRALMSSDITGAALEIVGRDIEEALDLPGVEIDRKDAVGPAAVMRLATSLAEIGVRGPGLRSCRA